MDPLDPVAVLEEVAALPLEARPQVLLRLADELERRIDSVVTPPPPAPQPGPPSSPDPLEQPPGSP